MTLEDLRADIDSIDARITALLEERMEKALLTKRLKTAGIEDKGRENAIIDKVRRTSRDLLRPDFGEELFRSIIAESKKLQEKAPRTVGFQGEHGAYSEMAAWAWDRAIATIPCHEFEDVFDGVDQGIFDYGIVPVENSLGGLVGPVNSILISTDLRIIAAVSVDISHCLLALPGADHRELRTVYSHPQALAQCRHFIERNKLKPMAFYDTAGAARMLSQEGPKGAAAIASRLAAELYDLEIIKDAVQDSPDNRTRFLVLSKKDSGEPGSKCSAVFSATDKAGALFEILEIFASSHINLTRIESVPNRPGDYAIFIDFEGSLADRRVADAVEQATSKAQNFRILGCYNERRL